MQERRKLFRRREQFRRYPMTVTSSPEALASREGIEAIKNFQQFLVPGVVKNSRSCLRKPPQISIKLTNLKIQGRS